MVRLFDVDDDDEDDEQQLAEKARQEARSRPLAQDLYGSHRRTLVTD